VPFQWRGKIGIFRSLCNSSELQKVQNNNKNNKTTPKHEENSYQNHSHVKPKVHCAAKLTHNFKTRVFEPNLFPVTTFRTVKY
jgi:hypothetical protein